MKTTFVETLHELMEHDKRIWLLTGDLGFGALDKIRDDFPDRFLNCGVAEQNMIGMACGMAQGGLIPFVYSITPFILYRGFEFVRNDVNYDKANVKLICAGRDLNYGDLGFSHTCVEDVDIMMMFPNIMSHWPETKGEVRRLVKQAVKKNCPYYINLKR